jgi:ABC-type Fe3+-siderophore transport system permease subunit
MYIVGYIATILAAIIVVGVIGLVAIMIPDIRRYLRIRNM